MKAFFRRAQKRASAIGRFGVVIAVLASPLAFSSPASAGTLTAPTWTALNTQSAALGSRYDYGFTTATNGTVSRVTATVPAGTSGSNRYVQTNGQSSSYVDTPDAPANDITGDIDVRMKLSLSSWTGATYQRVISKWGGGSNRSWTLNVTATGQLAFSTSSNGTNQLTQPSTVALTGIVPTNTPVWLRATFVGNNGSSGNTTTYYWSTDGTTWTLIGTPVIVAGTVSIYAPAGSSSLRIGTDTGGSGPTFGRFYYADVRSGIAGTTTSASNCASGVAVCLDPNSDTIGGSSWTSASPNAEVWALGRSGTSFPTDIASDLSVMNVSGVSAGGTAQLREIDGVASYLLPTAQTFSTPTAVKLGLAGMTNTFNQGAYTSVIKTLDSSSNAIDTSVATSSVTFTQASGSGISAPTPTYASSVAGTSAEILPIGLAINGNTVYMSDRYSSNINAYDSTTGNVIRFAGNGATIGDSSTGSPASASLYLPQGLAVDGSGNVLAAETSSAQVRKFTASTTSIIAGTTNVYSYTGDGTTGVGTLSVPTGVATDAAGNVYIADTGNHRIRKIDSSGNHTLLAGTGVAGSSGDGAAATSATLNNPSDLVAYGGSLYVTTSNDCRVRAIDLTSNVISTVAGTSCGFSGDGAAATSAKLNGPKGIAVASNGDIYIADSNNCRIRKITTGTGIISTVAGTGTCGFNGDGITATTAALAYPGSVRLDSSGNIYVADSYNYRLRKITSGVISTVAGAGTAPNYVGDGGPLSKARFWNPQQVSSDSTGNLFVADTKNNAIRKIDVFGTVTTVAGTGVVGSSGDGSAATSATINQPNGVIPDGIGGFFVGDTSNNKVRRVNSSGTISTFATVTSPGQLAYRTSTSDLFVASNGNSIYRVDSAGTATLYAGDGTVGLAGDGGLATSARFNNIKGILVDNAGNLIVADGNNYRVRMISPSGIVSTIAGGGADSSNSSIKATTALLVYPVAMVNEPNGDLLFADYGKLRRMRAGGAITAVTSGGFSNGGMACSLGSLYQADYYAMQVKKIPDTCAQAPLVNNDAMSVPMNTQRQWPILSNDWSRTREMDPTSVTITSPPTNGTAIISNPTTEASTLQAVYTPTTSYTGTDSFTYQACDTTRVQCSIATVAVTVSSNQVTTAVGGPSEGYGVDIGLTPSRISRYKNYLFISDTNFNVVRRFDTYSGQSVVIAGNASSTTSGVGVPATAAGFTNPQGIALDPSGNLFVADGTSNLVRLISTAGTITSTATISAPSALTVLQNGTLIATTGSIVQSYAAGSWSTFAGSTSGSSGNGGAATSAQFISPAGLYVSSNGDVYISDSGACVVRKISGGVVSAVAGTSGTCSLVDANPATSGTLSAPKGLSMDGAGTLLIADSGNNKIRKVTSAGALSTGSACCTAPTDVSAGASTDYYVANNGESAVSYTNTSGVVSKVNNTFGSSIYAGENRPGLSTQFKASWPDGLAVAPNGDLYFGSSDARIQKLDAITGLVTTVLGNSTVGTSGNLTGAGIRQIAFDTSGRVLFADASSKTIRRVDSVGNSTTIAGTPGSPGFSGDGGQATSAQLTYPQGLAVGADGSIYIGDYGRIRKVSPTGVITTIAGDGTYAYSGDGGLAINAKLYEPLSLALDNAGNLYFADKSAIAVRMIDTNGYISTVLGTGISGTPTEGARAATSQFGTPNSVALDASNNLYVTNSGNGIRRIEAATGNIRTVQSGSTAFIDNTTYTTAGVDVARSVAVNKATGDLYLIDQNNNRIRKVSGSGAGSTAVTTLASSAWNVVPAATGHTNLRERLTVTPAITTTASKLTVVLPTSFAATPTSIETYGLSGTVTPTLSGTTLTLSFPSQTITAGVPIGLSIEGVANGGANGAWTSYVTLYDSAGTTPIGWSNSNIVNITTVGAPVQGAAGFGSLWKRNLSTASFNTPASVNPSTTTDATGALTLTNSGTMNANTATFAATAMTTGTYGFTAITPDITTNVASASFTINRWGAQITSTGGTNASATGSGLFTGLSPTQTPVVTGAGATNVVTATSRAKITYLTPAGTYKSTLTWRFISGV